jgi:hypothetical protein
MSFYFMNNNSVPTIFYRENSDKQFKTIQAQNIALLLSDYAYLDYDAEHDYLILDMLDSIAFKDVIKVGVIFKII